MAKFAQNTDVSVEQSEAEIKRTIARYGATSFMSGYTGNRAIVAFEMDGKRIRFNLTLPDAAAPEFTRRKANQHEGSMVPQSPEKANALWQQACRQRWRALLLLIKAKLEAIEGNITSFEEEMLAHIVMPNGHTVAETILPGLQAALERGGSLPPLLGTELPPARKGEGIVIIALDPSSTCIGYARFTRDGELIDAGRVTTPAKPPGHIRMVKLAEEIIELVESLTPRYRIICVVEIPDGKVARHGRARGMNGAGLSVYGMAVGFLLGRLASHEKSSDVRMIEVNVWTRQVPKAVRQMRVAQAHAFYDSAKDPGGDVSDAIALGEWWITEERLKTLTGARA